MTTGNVMEPEEQLTTISLVLADRHPLTLNGLRQLFTAAEGFEILSVATQVDTAVDALRKHRPDVVVLDMLLPPNGGLTVLRQLRRLHRCARGRRSVSGRSMGCAGWRSQ